ncbi:MAG: VPDSG-CTERM sorting domain-containing protein, partial [Verrucomicrobiales bacterium]|nr:VPDSG-CTERM sorting domain-containing protein [Verrucomicrobiales bacterium]
KTILIYLSILTAASTAAHALSYVEATLSAFTGGQQALIEVRIDELLGGDLQVKLDVIDNPGSAGTGIGDLRGWWSQISNESLLPGLSLIPVSWSGLNAPATVDIVGTFGPANGVNDLGNGNNLNGGGTPAPLDFGVDVGTPGIGTDDIQHAIFNLHHSSVALSVSLFDGQVMGGRLTSLGASSRGDSSKLKGTGTMFTIADPIPQPVPDGGSTALLFGTSLVGLVLLRLRNCANQRACAPSVVRHS